MSIPSILPFPSRRGPDARPAISAAFPAVSVASPVRPFAVGRFAPIAVVLAVFLAASAPAFAQQTGAAVLTGTIVDANGPVHRSDVALALPGSGLPLYGTTSGEDGAFRLEGLRPGRYVMSVSYVGYDTWREEIELAAGTSRHVSIRLEPGDVRHPGVVVTAQRARERLTPVTASSVDAGDIEMQSGMKDIPAQLAALPSVTWYSENGNGMGYTYMQMRGFGQRRVAVSVNGIPQNDPEDFNVFWINFFDLSGVTEDIQVQRGAGSSTYGPAAIGGAVNIRALPYKPQPYASVELGAGAFDTRRMTFEANSGLLDDRWVVFTRMSRLQSDGYRRGSWSRFWRFFAGVTRYGEKSTLTLQGYGGPQEDGLAYIGIPKEANEGQIPDGFGGIIDRRYNYSEFTGDREWFHQPHAELLHHLELSGDAVLDQSLFWVAGTGYFDFDGTFRSADYLRLPESVLAGAARSLPLYETAAYTPLLFRAALDQWQVGYLPRITWTRPNGETSVGLEARLHRSLRWGRIQAADGLPTELVGESADRRVYSFRGEKAIGSVFASHLARPSDRWAIQADVQATWRRYRVYDEAFFGTSFSKPYVFVNPRVGVTWNPEQPFSAYASVSLASREPRLKALYDGEEAGAGFVPQFLQRADGSFDRSRPFVGSERVLDVEIGASWARDRWRAAVNTFWMGFSDEIVPSGGLDQFGVPRTGNADRTRHVGLEAEGAFRILPGVDLSGSATFSANRFVRFTEYVPGTDGAIVAANRDDLPIAGFPDVILNGALTARRGGASARFGLSYVGRQYVDNSGGIDVSGVRQDNLVVDPFLLLDASFRYRFGGITALRDLELSLDVTNLLDDEILMYGNAGYGAPQFFPAATRHAFFGIRYTIR